MKLTKIAQEYTALAAEKFFDDNNIVRNFLHFPDARPLTVNDFPPDTDVIGRRGEELVGFYMYENSGMAGGAFLNAESLRFKRTKETSALENAKRAFSGLKYIYGLGARNEEGFFPKPHGGQYTPDLSRDQYLYAMHGMDNYYGIASVDEKADIEKMIVTMSRWWMKQKYYVHSFGLGFDNLSDHSAPLFLSIIHLGYKYSNDRQFLDEYNRLIDEEDLAERMKLTLRRIFIRDRKGIDGKTIVARMPEADCMMRTITLDYLMGVDPQRKDTWLVALQRLYDEDCMMTLTEDNQAYHCVGLDPDTNTVFLFEPHYVEDKNPLNYPWLDWVSKSVYPQSVQTAFVGCVAAGHLNDTEKECKSEDILKALDKTKMKLAIDPDGNQLPECEKWRCNILYIDCIVTWLWAYQLGRSKDMFK